MNVLRDRPREVIGRYLDRTRVFLKNLDSRTVKIRQHITPH